jgi:hypothetical protein
LDNPAHHKAAVAVGAVVGAAAAALAQEEGHGLDLDLVRKLQAVEVVVSFRQECCLEVAPWEEVEEVLVNLVLPVHIAAAVVVAVDLPDRALLLVSLHEEVVVLDLQLLHLYHTNWAQHWHFQHWVTWGRDW